MSTPSAIAVGRPARVSIERMVFQGSGMGRLPDGRVVFVPYTAPGDDAEIAITAVRDDFVRGELTRLIGPSPARVTPPCRYYGQCGGCQWQHLEYPAQLAWKREIPRELLARVGKLTDVPISEPVTSAGPWEYRARAQFKVFAEGRPQIGFHQRETRRVVDIDRCPLLEPRLNGILRILRSMRDPTLAKLFPRLREIWVTVGTWTGEALISLFTHAPERAALRLLFHRVRDEIPNLQGVVLLDGDPHQHPRLVDRYGQGAIMEQVGAHRFRVDATAFFQVSGVAAETLTRLVVGAAGLTGGERVLALYSGVGTFAVPLARLAETVVGIEANAAAAADAVHNLRLNGCEGARILQAQVEQVLPSLAQEGRWDLVVLDPPRQGCSRRVLDAVVAMAAARIVYVSCDPSTLARDLGMLVPSGYRCSRLQPVDLFPQTFHSEAVAVLDRIG